MKADKLSSGKQEKGRKGHIGKAVLLVSFALVLAAFLGAGMFGTEDAATNDDMTLGYSSTGYNLTGPGDYVMNPGFIYEITISGTAGGAGTNTGSGNNGQPGAAGGKGARIVGYVDMTSATEPITVSAFVAAGGAGVAGKDNKAVATNFDGGPGGTGVFIENKATGAQIMVAGGGGGGANPTKNNAYVGGDAGLPTVVASSVAGSDGTPTGNNSAGGKGGLANGTGGTGGRSGSNNAPSGANAGDGGAGGDAYAPTSGAVTGGAGGGGGYGGGGGGNGGAGGGGSSMYDPNLVTFVNALDTTATTPSILIEEYLPTGSKILSGTVREDTGTGPVMAGVAILCTADGVDKKVVTNANGEYKIAFASSITVNKVKKVSYIEKAAPAVRTYSATITVDLLMEAAAPHTVTVYGTDLDYTGPDIEHDDTPLIALTSSAMPPKLPAFVIVEMPSGTTLTAGTDYTYNATAGTIQMIADVTDDLEITAVYSATVGATGVALDTVNSDAAVWNTLPVFYLNTTLLTLPEIIVTMEGATNDPLIEGTDYQWNSDDEIEMLIGVTGNIKILAAYDVSFLGPSGLVLDKDTAVFGERPSFSLSGGSFPPYMFVEMDGNLSPAANYISATGSITMLSDVTGNIKFTALYGITVNGTGLGVSPNRALFDDDGIVIQLSFNPSQTSGYPYDVVVVMDGIELTPGAGDDYVYASDGSITFDPALPVTGNIEITAKYTVTISGAGLSISPDELEFGTDALELAISFAAPATEWPASVAIKMNGTLVDESDYTYDPSDGSIVFDPLVTVTGNIEVAPAFAIEVVGTDSANIESWTPTGAGAGDADLEIELVAKTGYRLVSVTVTMNGPLALNTDFEFTASTGIVKILKPVDGEIDITPTTALKSYNITASGANIPATGSCTPPTADHFSKPVITINVNTGYEVTGATITMDGVTLTSGFTRLGNVITFTTAEVNGPIVITATTVAKTYNVTASGTHVTGRTPTTATHATTPTITINVTAGYEVRSVTVTMNSIVLDEDDDYTFDINTGQVTLIKQVDGAISIAAVTGIKSYAVTVTGTGVNAGDWSPARVTDGYDHVDIEILPEGYRVTAVAVTMGALLSSPTDYTWDADTSTVTIIKTIDGPVSIVATTEILSYDVEVIGAHVASCDTTSVDHFDMDVDITITMETYWNIVGVAVTMKGAALVEDDDYEFDAATGVLTIYGPVNGKIVITLTEEADSYSVTSAAGACTPNTVYHFDTPVNITVGNPGYHTTSVSKVTMNGSDLVEGTDYTFNPSTGVVTITKAVNGAIVITATTAVNTYTITVNATNVTYTSFTSPVEHGTAMDTITFTASEGYNLPATITVRMGGSVLPATAYTYNATAGTLSLASVTGDVVITVTGALIPAPEPEPKDDKGIFGTIMDYWYIIVAVLVVAIVAVVLLRKK